MLIEKILILYDFEEIIFKEFQEVQKTTLSILTNKNLSFKKNSEDCPICGEELEGKEVRSRKLITRFGEIEIKQLYRYCGTCKKYGYFEPLSEKPSYGRLSSKLTEIVCLEGKDMPFRLAADKMSRNFNVSISHDTIRRV